MNLTELFLTASPAEIAAALLMIGGAVFWLIAAAGLLRLPDVLMRMHASTKAGALGAGMVLVASALSFADTGAAARALGALAFLLLTAPVAAHVIGRAAYRSGAPLSARTWLDERRGERARAATLRAVEGAAPERPSAPAPDQKAG